MAKIPTFLPLPWLEVLEWLRGDEEVGGLPSDEAAVVRSKESERATRRIDGPASAPATAPMARAEVEVPEVMLVRQYINYAVERNRETGARVGWDGKCRTVSSRRRELFTFRPQAFTKDTTCEEAISARQSAQLDESIIDILNAMEAPRRPYRASSAQLEAMQYKPSDWKDVKNFLTD